MKEPGLRGQDVLTLVAVCWATKWSNRCSNFKSGHYGTCQKECVEYLRSRSRSFTLALVSAIKICNHAAVKGI